MSDVLIPCREWTGQRTKAGYGWKKRHVYMHRWVMAQIHGWEALKGKVVRHHCDNPPCYRYDHLQLGTQADNIVDMKVRGRWGVGEDHHQAKITDDDIDQMKAMYHEQGMKQPDIAEIFGVDRSHVSRIVRGLARTGEYAWNDSGGQ